MESGLEFTWKSKVLMPTMLNPDGESAPMTVHHHVPYIYANEDLALAATQVTDLNDERAIFYRANDIWARKDPRRVILSCGRGSSPGRVGTVRPQQRRPR